MLQPPSLANDEPLKWSAGRGTEVWDLFCASMGRREAIVLVDYDETECYTSCWPNLWQSRGLTYRSQNLQQVRHTRRPTVHGSAGGCIAVPAAVKLIPQERHSS